MKLALLVVIRNPDNSVKDNLFKHAEYGYHLYVYDNSDIISDTLSEIKKIKDIIYLTEGKNKGIGYAINYVAQRAMKDGFNYLLYMDQDSYFEGDTLKKMIYAFENQKEYDKEKTGIVSPVILYEGEKRDIYPADDKFEKVLITINSGSLMNLEILKKLGGVREDYFLDRIDFEYCLRLNKNGYYVLKYHNAFLRHKLGNLKIYNLFGFEIRVTNHSPFRHYYMTRNALDIVKNYFFCFPSHCLYELKSIFADLLKIILFENTKYRKIKYIFNAIFDFVLKKRKVNV